MLRCASHVLRILSGGKIRGALRFTSRAWKNPRDYVAQIFPSLGRCAPQGAHTLRFTPRALLKCCALESRTLRCTSRVLSKKIESAHARIQSSSPYLRKQTRTERTCFLPSLAVATTIDNPRVQEEDPRASARGSFFLACSCHDHQLTRAKELPRVRAFARMLGSSLLAVALTII